MQPHMNSHQSYQRDALLASRKVRQFLEQLAHHLALLVLGAGTQQAGWQGPKGLLSSGCAPE